MKQFCKANLPVQGELNFRQNPTFEDCFPASEKCYKTVTHDGLVLRVRTPLAVKFGASCETNKAMLAAGTHTICQALM